MLLDKQNQLKEKKSTNIMHKSVMQLNQKW